MSEKPIRRAISFVLRGPGGVLAVRRPPDDEDLPLAWGLPAASLLLHESWEDAVRRAAREKLGLDVEVGPLLNEGTVERDDYILRMRLYATTPEPDRTSDGTAIAPDLSREQAPGRPRTTRYVDWQWAENGEVFQPAAAEGSLCCRLYLDAQ